MTITIDKGVPLALQRRYKGKFPFPDMEVGDSFAVPYCDATRRNVHNCAKSFMAKHHITLAVRVVTEDGEERVRCWRTA